MKREQIEYQKLYPRNRQAAVAITRYLKKHKVISAADFKDEWRKSRKMPQAHLGQNFDTTIQFLYDHGIITGGTVNGHNFYFATQKCARTLMENMFREFETVLQSEIQQGIFLQKLNQNLVSNELEGEVIANILNLRPDTCILFAKMYASIAPGYVDDKQTERMLGEDYKKYAIINTLSMFPNVKRIDDVKY